MALSPTSSRGGGSAPTLAQVLTAGASTGGTPITGNLQVTAASGSVMQVTDNDGTNRISVDQNDTVIASGDGQGKVEIDSGGNLTVQAAGGGQTSLNGGGSEATFNLKDAADTPVRGEMWGHIVFRSGTVMVTLNSAPADGDINSGAAALWFDKTNGAGKLMIKAKTANGTVVTGFVALV
jgi:hypothetical protein